MLLVTKCCLKSRQAPEPSAECEVHFGGGPASAGSVFHSLNRRGLNQLRGHGKSKDSIGLIFTASAGTIAWVHERLLASNLMCSCHKSSLNATRSSLKTFLRMNIMIC